MDIDQDTLEILISRRLDEEITPIEDQLLQETLAADPTAMTLFEQLSRLHQSARAELGKHLRRGPSPQLTIQAALRRGRPSRRLAVMQSCLFSQFTRGLAAGLVIAIALQMVLARPAADGGNSLAFNEAPGDSQATSLPVTRVRSNAPIRRNVDWYQFTDDQGNQWIVEGLRENRVRPAAYDGDF